jgi:hypothetical protein
VYPDSGDAREGPHDIRFHSRLHQHIHFYARRRPTRPENGADFACAQVSRNVDAVFVANRHGMSGAFD